MRPAAGLRTRLRTTSLQPSSSTDPSPHTHPRMRAQAPRAHTRTVIAAAALRSARARPCAGTCLRHAPSRLRWCARPTASTMPLSPLSTMPRSPLSTGSSSSSQDCLDPAENIGGSIWPRLRARGARARTHSPSCTRTERAVQFARMTSPHTVRALTMACERWASVIGANQAGNISAAFR